MSLPVVAIVGRPNVGKSTLFNKLVGRRQALVADEPGLTRDRNYGEAEWQGVVFTVVDTGGLDPDARGGILVAIREQVQAAIAEADLILALFDARAGLTPPDAEVARWLRETRKPVCYAVNKVDHPAREGRAYEFYELGVPELHFISAEHSRGLDDLLDAVVKALAPSAPTAQEAAPPIRVAVVGRPNVGKSSLVNRLLGHDRVIVAKEPGTTRDAVDTTFERDGVRYTLIDTAGIRRRARVEAKAERLSVVAALRSLERCDVALVLLDAVQGVTDQDVRIAGYAHDRGRAVILVLNKWDLVQDPAAARAAFDAARALKLKFLAHAPALTLSAKTGAGVGRLFPLIAELLAQFTRSVPTARLNEALRRWVAHHEPPAVRGRPVKLYYATQVGAKPPAFLLFTNTRQPPHFSYQRYLANQLRETFGLAMTPLRLLFRPRRPSRREAA